MQFTPDGYVEPLPMRPAGIGLGLAVVAVSVALGWFVHLCVGLPVGLIGVLMALNEGGKRRIRVTRPRLLMEDETRVRGLLIGPSRSRVEWSETASVELLADLVKLTTTDGRSFELGKGGPKNELEKLFGRIEQVRNAPD